MKKLTALALAAAFSLTSAAALADHHGDKMGKKGEGHHGQKFEKIDTDGDGFLTRAEMEAYHKQKLDKMFEKADANKDGKLSREELQKGREEWREKMHKHFEKMKERRKSAEDKAE